jgi:hypothetical protein
MEKSSSSGSDAVPRLVASFSRKNFHEEREEMESRMHRRRFLTLSSAFAARHWIAAFVWTVPRDCNPQ